MILFTKNVFLGNVSSMPLLFKQTKESSANVTLAHTLKMDGANSIQHVLLGQSGTKRNLLVSVQFMGSILLITNARLAKNIRSGMGKSVFV